MSLSLERLNDYRPTGAASALHDIPRFANSNQVALLASPYNQRNYTDGLVAFAVVIVVLFTIWSCILLVLKYKCGVAKVGCAAGGEALDMVALREEKVPRLHRHNRIIRSWRLQTVFMLSSLMIIVTSFLLLNRGLRPFLSSLDEIVDINDEVGQQATDGAAIANDLATQCDKLHNMSSLNVRSYCPTSNNSAGGLNLTALQNSIMSGLDGVYFLSEYARNAGRTLQNLTSMTNSMDTAAAWIYSHDWMLEFLLLLLNVVNCFLLFGVILTKNNVDYVAYQAMLSYILIPAFIMLLLTTVVVTCTVAAGAMINADFCAGGSKPGSPAGTLEQFLLMQGFSATSLAYHSVKYYSSDCLSENPLSLFDDISTQIGDARNSIRSFLLAFNTMNHSELTALCGSNIATANTTLSDLAVTLKSVQGDVAGALGLMDCSNVNPILRKLYYGPTCTESMESITWIFSCLLGLATFGFILLSTRAALFNPILPSQKKRRREKEFDDYKTFMSQYYDTADWQMDPAKDLKKLETSQKTPSESEDTADSSSDFSASPSDDRDVEEDQGANKIQSDVTLGNKPMASPALSLPMLSDSVVHAGKDLGGSDDESTDSDFSDDFARSTTSLSGLVNKFFRIGRSAIPVSVLDVGASHDMDDISSDMSAVSSKFATPVRLKDRNHQQTREMAEDASIGFSDVSLLSLDDNIMFNAPEKEVKTLARTSGGALIG